MYCLAAYVLTNGPPIVCQGKNSFTHSLIAKCPQKTAVWRGGGAETWRGGGAETGRGGGAETGRGGAAEEEEHVHNLQARGWGS